jgi:hypothetical protein
MLRGLLLLWAVLSACVGASAADLPGTITILEGDALIVRGANRLRAAEGVRLASGDIVETAASAFVQIELSDQTVLQVGGATKVMVGGPVRLKAERTLYALSGWFKATNARKEAGTRGFDLRSPLFEIAALPGVVVTQIKPSDVTLFAERGDVKLVERQSGASAGAVVVKTGQYYRRTAGSRGAASATRVDAFVGELPRAFRDSLPLRGDRYKDREVSPKPAPDFVYEDVEAWLKTESPFRRQFIERWRSKARDPAFRAALIANLKFHPEWDPVLFPEKYLPKEPVNPASAAQPSGAPVPRPTP